jgi:hypothetical protein
MRGWINSREDTVIYGTGISTFPDESDALIQATTLARADLAGKIETQVAAITKDFRSVAQARGETERLSDFEAGTKQLVNQTITGARTYGPEINGKGNTYIIVYVDQKTTEKNLTDHVRNFFSGMESELDKQLDANK